MAAIANGGKLMRPYVVKAVVHQSGRTVEETKPRVVRRVISAQTSRKITRILEQVVTEEGTGSHAAINGYGTAGKTGTAEKVDPKTKAYSYENYVSSFVGFVPADNPELVIHIMVDEPKPVHYGGLVAAPAFQEVGAWTLHHLRIPPQNRLAEKKKASQELRKRTSNTETLSKKRLEHSGRLPDFTGQSMREVLNGGRALGLSVVLEGTGLAVKQTPQPGSSLEKTKTVKVTFSPPV
jgi:cell division protein FtsI (penicillin-binding protein 3)